MTLAISPSIVDLSSPKACKLDSDRLFAETGCYSGISELEAKQADPVRYESLHTQLRAAVISAKETARRITASSAVREEGEFVVTLYTLEGDAIVLSTGIMIHVHTVSRFIKWMIDNDYESDPGFNEGDIFGNNDPFIGDVHAADMMDVIPLCWEGKQIGWVGAVSHLPDIGGVEPGGECATVSDRFGEGMFISAEKIGHDGELRRDYLVRLEHNLRSPIYWILDEKAKVAACQEVAETVHQVIERFGLDYYLRATRELIEENRRGHLQRVKNMLVPGVYRGTTHYTSLYADNAHVVPQAAVDRMYVVPLELTIDGEGQMKYDFEGTPEPGPHSANCTEAGMDGGMFITLTQLMDFDTANHGAWLATDLVLPPGTLVNPADTTAATSTSWSVLVPSFAVFQRLVSRALHARGFLEEVFLGGAATPFQEAGGINHYGERFGAGNFECGACGSGARAIADGIDTGYTGWNPEGDMGSVEIWELEFPFLYMGRRNLIDSGGAGRYRGGAYFAPVLKVHGSQEVSIATKECPGRTFDQTGLFGGYPAPTAHRHYAVRNTNLPELIEARAPLPHSITSDGTEIEIFSRVEGDKQERQGQFASSLFKHDDLFAHMYSSGGGLGDPLTRDAASVAKDLAEGVISKARAVDVYGVVLGDGDALDADGTAARRDAIRQQRLDESVPVSEWIDGQREQVRALDYAPLVKQMYESAFRVSPRYRRGFAAYWGIDEAEVTA